MDHRVHWLRGKRLLVRGLTELLSFSFSVFISVLYIQLHTGSAGHQMQFTFTGKNIHHKYSEDFKQKPKNSVI